MSEPILFESRLFDVVRKVQKGTDGRDHLRDIIRHPGAVVIVPIFDDGRVCLIENFRVSVEETLLELPAGTREPGEPPIETARRELAEETGYRCESLEPLCRFLSSPGILNEQMHLFLASGLTDGEMALEAGEQIEPKLFEMDEALEMILDGRIHDGKTIAGLLFYDRFRRTRN